MSLYDTLRNYCLNCCEKKPATVHFTFRDNNKGRSLCNKVLKTIYCEYVDSPAQGAQHGYYYGHQDHWVMRRTHIDEAGRQRLTLCGPCRREYFRKVDEAAAEVIRIRNAGGDPAQPVAKKPERDWMAEPKRPPGTEEMTCHLDEGSVAGACGEGGTGFRTNYLPWINCGGCLVQLDWSVESALLELRGLYVVPWQPKPETQ